LESTPVLDESALEKVGPASHIHLGLVEDTERVLVGTVAVAKLGIVAIMEVTSWCLLPLSKRVFE
jgi:hypothetical protein